MRTIASQAGTTIGNIYSYFSSKNDLFNYVVSPAAKAIDELTSLEFKKYESDHSKELTNISKKICAVFVANKERFFILMNGSSGSKFAVSKENIIDLISKRFQTEMFPSLEIADNDPLFAQVLATSLLSGFLTIFNNYGGDDSRLMLLINGFLAIYLKDISDNM